MVLLHSNYTYPEFNAAIGSFHMAVFFFVAGLFAKGKDTSISSVIKKSFYQLIIPYFAFSLIALSYGWVYPYLHPDLYYTDRSFTDIFKKAIIGILLMRDRVTDYAFLPGVGLWFLSSLFWCRVLFSIWIHDNKRDWYALRLLIIAFLLVCYYFKISYLAFNSTAVSFPYFVLGYYINRLVVRDYGNVNVIYFIFIAIFGIAAIFMMTGHSVMPDDAEINGLTFLAYLRGILGIAAVLSIAIILEKSRWKPIVKFLKYTGEATLTILGLHIAGVIVFKVIYVLLGHPKEEIPMFMALPVSLLIVLICAFIHHHYFAEKTPWITGKNSRLRK